MLTFAAFLFALTLLVSVHEWGHYRVAVALGVKVVRFSIGLGPAVWRKSIQLHGQKTEFSIGLLPLGGYVLMLDEAHGPVLPEQAHQAFNRQPLWARALIVAAGPVANLVLAVVLLAAAAWWGQSEPMAMLSTPLAQSAADKAGLVGGERVVAAGAVPITTDTSDAMEPLALQPIASFSALLPSASEALRQGQDWALEVQDADAPNAVPRRVRLQFAHLPQTAKGESVSPLDTWGIGAPQATAMVAKVEPGSPAFLAGLLPGDQVLKVNGLRVADAQSLRQTLRQSGASGTAQPLQLEVLRQQEVLALSLQPTVIVQAGQTIGRMGAVVGALPTMQWVEQDLWDSVAFGIQKTYALTSLTLRMIGGLFTGQGGLDQLGGPLTIADQAGRSALMGITAYLGFLGFLSISLGVLNLLPLPMLDGGHLMYYLWELLTGQPVSSVWVNVLQKVGLMLLVAVMVTALVNDGMRLWR